MAVKAHVMLTPFDATTGAALTGATVNVFSPGTVTPVAGTLFDKNGNALTNPLTSDASTGLVDFYMNVAQEVDLQVAKSGYTTRTYSNVPVLDDASFDLSALMTTTGDIVYASSANTPARLALGANGTFLTVHGGLPVWQNTIDAGGITITAGGLTVTAGGISLVAGNMALTTGQTIGNSLASFRAKDLGSINNATAVVVDDVAASLGILLVVYGGGAVAGYALNGGAHTTTLLFGPGATFTTTFNNANTVNVYWNTSDYFLQNNTGGANTFRTFLFSNG